MTSWVKFILFFFQFLKEVIFGKPHEQTNDGVVKKLLKWFLLLFIVISLTTNYFTVKKIYVVSLAYVKLKEKQKHYDEMKEELDDEKLVIKELRIVLNTCLAKK